MKDIRIIQDIYWQQTTYIPIGNDFNEFTKIIMGVRPRCVFTPELFNLYSEAIVRELKALREFFGGTVLIADIGKYKKEENVSTSSCGQGVGALFQGSSYALSMLTS